MITPSPEAIEAAGHAMYGEDGWKSATDWWLARHRHKLRQTLAAAQPYLIADAQAAERDRIASAIEDLQHIDTDLAFSQAYAAGRNDGRADSAAIARQEPTDDR